MSTLDDALSGSAPVFNAPDLYVNWRETLEGEELGPENLREMSDVLSSEYIVTHSLDDGMPDSVTMTGSSDAAGKMEATVVGRPGLVYDSWTAATPSTGTIAGPTTDLGTSLPGAVAWGSYMLMFVTVPSLTAVLTQGSDEQTKRAWTLVGTRTSTTLKTWVFAKRYVTGMSPPTFQSSVSVSNVVYACTAVQSVDPSGNVLEWRINAQGSSAASGSATVHTQAPVTISSRRSVVFAVWSAPGSSSWTVNAPDTLVASVFGTTSIVIGRGGLYTNPTTQALAATRSVASSDVAMMSFALEPWERRDMSPTEFWSPFYTDSPVYGFDRDTASVQLTHNTVTEDGTQGVILFTGQMEDVPLNADGDVQIKASSQVRLTLNRSVSLPQVWGRRDGCSIDWMVAWLAARGDRFVGQAPGPFARWWVPCYGSVHTALGHERSYSGTYKYFPGPVRRLINYPTFVEGPFNGAVYAKHTLNETIEAAFLGIDLYKSKEVWPWVSDEFPPDGVNFDLMSPNNSAGRVTFWIRGDASYAGTPTNVPSNRRYLMSFLMEAWGVAGDGVPSDLKARVWCYIDTDRTVYLQMGSPDGGTTTVNFTGAQALPSDGQWHFYSFSWDFTTGVMKTEHNGTQATSNLYATNGDNSKATWVHSSDEDLYDRGGRIRTEFTTHLPLSDMILSTGSNVFNSNADIWPAAEWPSFTVTTRPTGITMEGVFNDVPVNAWDALADLARNSMSMYRTNEVDYLEFLPPSYFGETAQMTSAYDVDTDTNAQPLTMSIDPGKTRNVITAKFTQQNVDLDYTNCLLFTSYFEIPRGRNSFVFVLDETIADSISSDNPYTSNWTVFNLTSSQITTGWSAVPAVQMFMTVNTASDGTGTVLLAASVSAKMVAFSSTTITIEFNNKTPSVAYLANNNSAPEGTPALPSMRLLGYVVRSADAYVTVRDTSEWGVRRERATEFSLDWLTDGFQVYQLSSQMLSLVNTRRSQIMATVQGDPRRTPGQLVTVRDAYNTHADGLWRVLSIGHNNSGAAFSQALSLVKELPLGVWDDTSWDDSVWGE